MGTSFGEWDDQSHKTIGTDFQHERVKSGEPVIRTLAFNTAKTRTSFPVSLRNFR